MAETMIAPTMSAQTSQTFLVNGSEGPEEAHIESTLFHVGLAGAEKAVVHVVAPDGQAQPLVIGGVEQALTADNTTLVVRGSLPIRVVKTSSNAAVGIYLSTPSNV